jgi:hypothetical protein
LFVSPNHFQPSLIFEGKAGVHLNGRLYALLFNYAPFWVRLGKQTINASWCASVTSQRPPKSSFSGEQILGASFAQRGKIFGLKTQGSINMKGCGRLQELHISQLMS